MLCFSFRLEVQSKNTLSCFLEFVSHEKKCTCVIFRLLYRNLRLYFRPLIQVSVLHLLSFHIQHLCLAFNFNEVYLRSRYIYIHSTSTACVSSRNKNHLSPNSTSTKCIHIQGLATLAIHFLENDTFIPDNIFKKLKIQQAS